jgi:hypothetical protein
MAYYNLRMPEASRSLLLYRYYRLDAAVDRAKEVSFLPLIAEWKSFYAVWIIWGMLSLAKRIHWKGRNVVSPFQSNFQTMGSRLQSSSIAC